MRARRNKAVTEGNDETVDMTPMLDVVFILLIFFIITASFVKEHTLNTQSPAPGPAGNSTAIPIRVTIQEDNTVLIDDIAVTSRALRSVFTSKQAGQAERPNIVIHAHEHAQTQTYASVIDAARSSGVNNIVMTPFSGRD